jgi:hypothetical protein
VETLTPGARGATAPAGLVGVIAVRRFRPGSRGFTLLSEAPKGRKKRATAQPASTGKGARRRAVSAGGPLPAQIDPGVGCGVSDTRLRIEVLARPQEVESIAGVLADRNAVLPLDYRAAAALIGLLGAEATVEFLASTSPNGTPVRRYNDHGVGVLLIAATDWAGSRGLLASWGTPDPK